MPGRKVLRLWRGGRHTGPRPAAVPSADERPAPHLRHDLPECERRAAGQRGGGPGEGRQVPPESLGYSSPEPGGTTQQQQQASGRGARRSMSMTPEQRHGCPEQGGRPGVPGDVCSRGADGLSPLPNVSQAADRRANTNPLTEWRAERRPTEATLPGGRLPSVPFDPGAERHRCGRRGRCDILSRSKKTIALLVNLKAAPVDPCLLVIRPFLRHCCSAAACSLNLS